MKSSQIRKEEAVKRHFRLSCVAQSLLQKVTCYGQKSEKFEFDVAIPRRRQALTQLRVLGKGTRELRKKSQLLVSVLIP